MQYMERPGPDEYDDSYAGYIARLPEGDLVAILGDQHEGFRKLLADVTPEKADYAYAPGKWTVKEVVGHLGDTERILSYRALRIARGDKTPLAGFEENDYVPAADFGSRSLGGLLEEFQATRRATVALFDGLQADAWARRGTASGSGISVRALACIIAGHELHHRALLRERYGVG